MKKLLTTLCMLSAVAFATAQSLSFKANTGDAELDVALSDINKQGTADFKLFKKDLSVSFGVTEGKIDELSVKFGMKAGDIYFALELAKQLNKPVDVVAEKYKTHKAKGWGVIAKELGIKPGSKEFHALKDASKGKNKKMKENKGKGNKTKGNTTPSKGTSTKKETESNDEKENDQGENSKGNGNGGGNGKGKGKK